MISKRVIAAVFICLALLVGWQYRSRIADLFSEAQDKKAEAAVAAMFDAWGKKHYEDLEKATFNNGSPHEMVLNMIKTPIAFRNLKIGQAVLLQEGVWLVPVVVELTDPASAMSSLIDFEQMRPSLLGVDL